MSGAVDYIGRQITAARETFPGRVAKATLMAAEVNMQLRIISKGDRVNLDNPKTKWTLALVGSGRWRQSIAEAI